MLSFGRAVSATVRIVACISFSALVVTAGCGIDKRSTLDVIVEQTDMLPPITRVLVTASTNGRMVSVAATGTVALPLIWPASLVLDVAVLPLGDVVVEAVAFDNSQTMVARGAASVVLPETSRVEIQLRCQSLVCSQGGADAAASNDGGDAGTGRDGVADAVAINPSCGNGILDRGETCDVARAPELLGACPESCDDGNPCTSDERRGDQCAVSCHHEELTATVSGDGCCPARTDHDGDADCSATCGDQRIDPGETCDTGITTAAGACPSAASCDDKNPCTVDRLISAGTCAARCLHVPVLTPSSGDGCCPLAADATTDTDCPAACGNGVVERGESCDQGLPSGQGSCPTPADCDDGDGCTSDAVTGSGCQVICANPTIADPVSGDGCCPVPGLGRNIDADCPAVCGNGVTEAGETCDMALPATAAGACTSSCPAAPLACVSYILGGNAVECSATCVATPVAVCSPLSDGCCPSGCTHALDPDCFITCGNGMLDPGEACDTAIAVGMGACPRSCADGVSCTDDLLVDADTCNARCLFIATTSLRDGDGCCPPNAHAGVDADCPATCGNAVVETPWETCDTATTPASCAATCPPALACEVWTRTVTSGCDVRCTRRQLTNCGNGDGCCPAGCNAVTDADCAPRCGNGVLEGNETCDRGMTAGRAGACPSTCDDANSCTLDFARGTVESCTRACSHVPVTACAGGDRCCPEGCTDQTDGDCAPQCRDGRVQAQETCDPISTCPTSCASDGDACTLDQLVGSADACNAACAYVPILRCSGAQRDGCCPTECSATSDSDC